MWGKKKVLFLQYFSFINRTLCRRENICISSLLLVETCVRHISLTSYFNFKTETVSDYTTFSSTVMIDNVDQNRLAVSNIRLGPFRMGFQGHLEKKFTATGERTSTSAQLRNHQTPTNFSPKAPASAFSTATSVPPTFSLATSQCIGTTGRTIYSLVLYIINSCREGPSAGTSIPSLPPKPPIIRHSPIHPSNYFNKTNLRRIFLLKDE